MTEKQMRETYLSRIQLDSDTRLFYCDDRIKMDYEKVFNFVNSDVKMLQVANDELGMTSDCFILYAIAQMGCATKSAIVNFLTTLHDKNPQLNILFEEEGVRARLRYLSRLGMVMRYRYDAIVGPAKTVERISLYIASEDAVFFVRNHLRKRTILNAGLFTKHIHDLIGLGCASYVGSYCALNNRGFVDYEEGVLRTKQMGTMFFPCEWKSFVDNQMYYVAFMPHYLEFDKSYMTKRDYMENGMNSVNAIRNYLNCRTTKGIPCVVIVVEDNADLNNVTLNIMASGMMNGMLDNIYFIGEGSLRYHQSDCKQAFFRMELDENAKEGYTICACRAPFMA